MINSTTVIHVGDVGTIFELTIVEEDGVTPVDVSSATVKKINFKTSDETFLTKTAVFVTDGSDGKIKYVGVADDIDVAGNWHMQGYVEMPSGKFYSQIVNFVVEAVLA